MKKIILIVFCSLSFFCFGAKININILDTATVESRAIDNILKTIEAPKVSKNVILITNLGAKGDSKTDNKPFFDKAMKQSKAKKGAKIVVPAGVYLINGPIHFVSNTTLELQKDAKIIFGTNEKDYLPAVLTSWEGTLIYNYSPLIYAYQVENVAIIGEGTIDGNGKDGFSQWYDKQKPAQAKTRDMNLKMTPVKERIFGKDSFLRPQLVQFFESKNILIEGVTITNAPFWCVHFLKSENITARKVKFDSQNKNNDGFDIEYSKNVLIDDVDFDNADDNVTIKAGRDREGRETNMPSENIIVRNSRFKGLHAIVIGSEMSSGVRNVFVENSTFAGYCKRALYLKSNADRGGYIKDIYINNVDFGEVEDAIYITSFYKGEGEGHETDIHNLFVNNFKVKKATNAGIVIQGYPTKKVNNIVFSNVKINEAQNAISMTNTENIIFNNVTIGKEEQIPSSKH
ncbi:glycoside hydrolase family 28 protein [Epilithonimonas lactis]|uniref:Glycoside hydrolase n=1 Tax=Epilithonimonas lactis TaxID=421072 RepID=A0A085BEX9_9FLAO|nr:glycosyl hydrolase family 28 protein [Epilithonimonas lactis]KFC21024.1 glycoside hydrolase [Epilithonimonas lactis]SEP70283.1 Glycosyl hydrolases family 28 [Epilithonimonas lactis]